MSDDFLTTFRSEMPMPDEKTTQRTYERATSGKRRTVTQRRLVIAVAVLALAGVAAVLGVTLGGGGSKTIVPGLHGPGPHPGGGMALAPFTLTPHVANSELTSLDVTLRSTHPDNTLDVKVVRQYGSQVVFSEQVTPTVYDSSMQDATHASWSGTLNPSDWSGGCQTGLYRVEYAFASYTDATDWFRCTGVVGPTGSTRPTG